MLITPSVYPQFSAATLEELTLQLARKILEVQSNPTLNLTNEFIITIDENITKETTAVSLSELQGNLNNGIVEIKNYFDFPFDDGVGSYPFNKTNLVDAFFHVLAYQQKQELIIAKNPGSKMCCDFSVSNVAEMNMAQQLTIDCSLTDYPILVNNASNTRTAKPYLI